MKFRTKIWVCVAWILAMALGFGGAILIRASFLGTLDREKDSALRSYRMTLSAMEILSSWAESEEDGRALCANTLKQMASTVGWTSCRLSYEDEELLSSGTVFYRETSQPELDNLSTRVFQYGADRPGHYFQVSGGVRLGQSRMILTVVTDVSQVFDNRGDMLLSFRWMFLITLAAGALASFILAAALTRPLGRMSKAARKMAQGDLSVRLRVRSDDEIGALARDFDHMADKLEENIHAMEETVAAQERFMGSFVHELKTPMTSIIGYADLLRTQALEPEDAQTAAAYIFSEGKRLESLSLKLLRLQLAKHEPPDLKPVEVTQLVKRLMDQLRPVFQKDHIRVACKGEPGTWEMDSELMESVLMNLMDNARKAMEQGGMILVQVDFPQDCCRIRVADNGRGMPEESLKHLTEAFYRVDKSRSRAQGGAGLGLSLCNEIVQIHNGVLRFASKLGVGTCATVVLKRKGEER